MRLKTSPNIRKLRKDSGKTVAQICVDTGLTATQLHSWERGYINPDRNKLELLAESLKVNVSALIESNQKQYYSEVTNIAIDTDLITDLVMLGVYCKTISKSKAKEVLQCSDVELDRKLTAWLNHECPRHLKKGEELLRLHQEAVANLQLIDDDQGDD